MTVAERQTARPRGLPVLENGDRLTREAFERRAEAMHELKKAELLNGLVYIAPPVRLDRHGEPQLALVGWIAWYKLATPGLRAGDNSTVRLGPQDEAQPDALLMIPLEQSGQSYIDADGYVAGAPELAVEVAASSVSYDLHVKKGVYQAHGVREYVVWRVDDRAVDWFVLREGGFEALDAGPDGILRSVVFPGLWLDPAALIRGDGLRLMAVLQQGLGSPEHDVFAHGLAGE